LTCPITLCEIVIIDESVLKRVVFLQHDDCVRSVVCKAWTVISTTIRGRTARNNHIGKIENKVSHSLTNYLSMSEKCCLEVLNRCSTSTNYIKKPRWHNASGAFQFNSEANSGN
jgi:hypothetical protein